MLLVTVRANGAVLRTILELSKNGRRPQSGLAGGCRSGSYRLCSFLLLTASAPVFLRCVSRERNDVQVPPRRATIPNNWRATDPRTEQIENFGKVSEWAQASHPSSQVRGMSTLLSCSAVARLVGRWCFWRLCSWRLFVFFSFLWEATDPRTRISAMRVLAADCPVSGRMILPVTNARRADSTEYHYGLAEPPLWMVVSVEIDQGNVRFPGQRISRLHVMETGCTVSLGDEVLT